MKNTKLLEKGRYYIFQEETKKAIRIRQELKPLKGRARFVTLATYKK